MGVACIQSALCDRKESEPDSYSASLVWPATGEHLTRDSFARYRKEGGMVILPANTQENIDIAIESPLTMIASDVILPTGKDPPRPPEHTAPCSDNSGGKEKNPGLWLPLKRLP